MTAKSMRNRFNRERWDKQWLVNGATVSRALILISIRGNPVLGQHYRFAITGETNQKLVLLPGSYNCLPVLFHRHYCFQSYCEITSRSVLI